MEYKIWYYSLPYTQSFVTIHFSLCTVSLLFRAFFPSVLAIHCFTYNATPQVTHGWGLADVEVQQPTARKQPPRTVSLLPTHSVRT